MAPGLEATQIFSFGREDISPLRLNPLQPPPGIRCAAHIGSLISRSDNDVVSASSPCARPNRIPAGEECSGT